MQNNNENEYVTQTNCNDRRKPIDAVNADIKKEICSLSTKMNWFYILAIATLISVIFDIIKAKG